MTPKPSDSLNCSLLLQMFYIDDEWWSLRDWYLWMFYRNTQQILSGIEPSFPPTTFTRFFTSILFCLISLNYDMRTVQLRRIEFSVISVWSANYFSPRWKENVWAKLMESLWCAESVSAEHGGWWRTQTRPGTQPIRAREFPSLG